MSRNPNAQRGFRPPGGAGHNIHAGMMPVQKAKNFKATLFRLLEYLRPHSIRLSIVAAAAIVSTIFSILSPFYLGKATDLLAKSINPSLGKSHAMHKLGGFNVNVPALIHILLTLAVLYFVSAIFSYIQQYVMAGIAQRTVFSIRQRVNEKLSRLPLKFFDGRPNGDILSRFINDCDNISNTLQQSLTQVITSVVTLVGVVIMMLRISLIMTLVVVLTLPLSFLVTRVIAKRSQRFFVGQQKSLGELNGHIEEMYAGHTIVKAFGNEEKAIETFRQMNDRLYDSAWKAQFVSGIIMPLMNFIGNIGYVFVTVIGGLLVTRGRISIGDILAFIQYTRQFSQPITQLSSIANIIQSTIASAERVFELLDEEEEIPEIFDAKVLHGPQGQIEFENVEFHYRSEQPLIQDMNISVKPGQTVAIVGPTGAGKTTIVNLLMRFYELQAGQIRIDGVDITEMKRSNLRTLFGMVLQDTWLFHGTIRDNIAYGREGATNQEVIEAAKAARADHFIRTLPAGYETMLNEEVSNISQGQKQLLTIARAILSNPAILLLDEATSSVDTRTEILIQQAMQTLMKGRTSFVIAHRLSTIRDADLILVMNHGRVIEQGSHHELLNRGGFYAELYNSQFAVS